MSGKKGMNAIPRRLALGQDLELRLPVQEAVLVLDADKPGPPCAAAASASRSWAAEKLEHPISRTLPSSTRSASAARVSAIGVAGSGRCNW